MNQVKKLSQLHALLLLAALIGLCSMAATAQDEQLDEEAVMMELALPVAPAEVKETLIPAVAVVEGVTYHGEAFLVQPGQLATLMPDKKSPEFQSAVGQPFLGEGQSLELQQASTLSITSQSRMDWVVPAGQVQRVGEGLLEWKAPLQPGNYLIELQINREEICLKTTDGQETVLGSGRQSNSTTRFMMLVQYPYDRDGDGQLAGSPVGIYPNEDAENASTYVAMRRDLYRPPEWFVKLTPEVADLHVSQHFRLKDFAPDADLEKGPAFIVLSFRLIERLESLIMELKASGHEVETLKIARGFLTPNQQLQLNRKGADLTEFTRHIYGDAAVLFVDVDGDGLMDDLNRDGEIDVADAEFLGSIVDGIERKVRKFGGMGLLAMPKDPNLPRTPCIAIDMRGSRARW